MSSARNRLALFALAFALRSPLAWLTFGTTDLSNSFRNTALLLGGFDAQTPYLPGIELFLAIGGTLALHTALPAAFAYKLFPIAFDSLIAVQLGDARSVRHGILYAIAPVPVMVAAMHGQWDAIVLYFLLLALVLVREHPALGAAAWVVSAVFKPFTLPLLLLLLPRERKAALSFVGGAAAAGAVYLALLALVGHPLTLDRIQAVLAYAGGGERLFGIPFRTPRLIALIPLAALAILYWLRKLEREEAVLLFFAFTIALSGLAAQYLTWIVPFALLCDRRRFAAVYTLLTGTFLALYYAIPLLNVPNVIALGAYGMLRGAAWLTPATPSVAIRPALQFAGNVAIPLLCLGSAAWWLYRRRESQVSTATTTSRAAVTVCALAGVLGLWALTEGTTAIEFVNAIHERVSAYDVVVYRGPLLTDTRETVWIPSPRPRAGITLLPTLIVWTMAASVGAWPYKEKGPRV